ncbi:MAG: SPFH domain-containing protein [Deltaproteobacteria bacterium]|jgi:flotillin|nr:SPFH domain-containing protein [Deltaproteobacteria bacterium]
MLTSVSFLVGVVVILVVMFIFIVRNIIHICPPNKVVVFSGRYRKVLITTKDGKKYRKKLGYRIIKGGKGFRMPLFESVDSMDLTNIMIEVIVEDAFAKGAIPLAVAGVANVKIAGEEPTIRNAIERFLGRPRSDIIRIARETLEGNLRGVLAKLTPQEVNEDRLRFAKELQDEADEDLAKLGLILDTLKIQNVSDKVSYLSSVGRIRNAEAQRNARVATAENWVEATLRDIDNKKEKELIKVQVRRKTVEAELAKRMKDAQTRRAAIVADEKAQVAALVAKAEAELEMQKARYIQNEHQLEADVIKPAKAKAEADHSKAQGAVAQQIEEGRAKAAALKAIITQWKASGKYGKEIFLLQKLEKILPKTLEVLKQVKVDQRTYLPEGNSLGGNSAKIVEEVKAATGVDLAKIGKKLEGN